MASRFSQAWSRAGRTSTSGLCKISASGPGQRLLLLLAHRAGADLHQVAATLAERLQARAVTPVEQPGGGADGRAERLVVGLPPEVAGHPRLPGDELHVHALVEAELGVRPADS